MLNKDFVPVNGPPTISIASYDSGQAMPHTPSSRTKILLSQ